MCILNESYLINVLNTLECSLHKSAESTQSNRIQYTGW